MLLHTIFILLFIKESIADCTLDTGPSDTEYENQLQKDLLANYDDFEPPDKNNTTVAIRFLLKNFRFFRNEASFNIYSWLFFQWDDPRLKWNPDEYGGVDSTIIHSIYIWSPLGYLVNFDDVFNSVDYYHYTYCRITKTGHVLCVLRVIHETVCLAKLFDWPYDYQICNFTFGVREGVKDNVKFTFSGTKGLSAFGTEYGSGWTIMDYEVSENTTCKTKFYLKFVLERQAIGMAVLTVIPLIIVAVMNLSSMLLDVRNVNRLALLSFSLFGHLIASDNISGNIPHYGVDIPSVLIFTRTSLFVTLFSMFLTIILNSLTRRNKKCYEWIKLFNNYILKSPLRFAIFPKWHVKENLIEEQEHADRQTWIDFASIVNSFYMMIIVVIYIVLYALYIPKPIPMDQEYDIH